MLLRANIWSFRAVQCHALFVQLTADQIKYLVTLNFDSVAYASFPTKVLRSFLECAGRIPQVRTVKNQHHHAELLWCRTWIYNLGPRPLSFLWGGWCGPHSYRSEVKWGGPVGDAKGDEGHLYQTEFPVFDFVLELVLSGNAGRGNIVSHHTE